MEPRLIPMEPGGWLAVTATDAPEPIGVFGASPDEARVRLAEALATRERIHAQASRDNERVALPLDPEDALRALLKGKPDDPPVDDHDDPAE